jgi:hypothetical protein
MRDIRASAEVLALIGAEKLRELHGERLHTVPVLAVRQGRPDHRADRSGRLGLPGFRTARLTHAACANSQLIRVNAAGWAVDANRHTASKPAEHAGSFVVARTIQ